MLDDPATDQLQPLHDRTYAVQVFRRDARCILVRGMVHDVKPPGLYVDVDPDLLTMHRMRVELEIEYPALVIRLLQAMAPAAVQSTWSMGILNQRAATTGDDAESAGASRQPRRPTAVTCGRPTASWWPRSGGARPCARCSPCAIASWRSAASRKRSNRYSDVGPVNSAARFSRSAARPSAASGPPKP